MKKLKAALICASLFVPLSEAIADDFSGVKLYQYCNNHDRKSLDNLTCTAFIHGLLDGIVLGKIPTGYCLPKDGVSVTQGRLIIEKYMRDHPEELDQQAGLISALAMYGAFPCPTK